MYLVFIWNDMSTEILMNLSPPLVLYPFIIGDCVVKQIGNKSNISICMNARIFNFFFYFYNSESVLFLSHSRRV